MSDLFIYAKGAYCKNCERVVISFFPNNFKVCKCHRISIKGGLEEPVIGGLQEDYDITNVIIPKKINYNKDYSKLEYEAIRIDEFSYQIIFTDFIKGSLYDKFFRPVFDTFVSKKKNIKKLKDILFRNSVSYVRDLYKAGDTIGRNTKVRLRELVQYHFPADSENKFREITKKFLFGISELFSLMNKYDSNEEILSFMKELKIDKDIKDFIDAISQKTIEKNEDFFQLSEEVNLIDRVFRNYFDAIKLMDNLEDLKEDIENILIRNSYSYINEYKIRGFNAKMYLLEDICNIVELLFINSMNYKEYEIVDAKEKIQKYGFDDELKNFLLNIINAWNSFDFNYEDSSDNKLKYSWVDNEIKEFINNILEKTVNT